MERIKLSRGCIREWIQDEWGSWEDAGRPTSGHVLNILQTGRVANADEARMVLDSAIYNGSYSGWDERNARHMQAIDRAAEQMRVYLSRE